MSNKTIESAIKIVDAVKTGGDAEVGRIALQELAMPETNEKVLAILENAHSLCRSYETRLPSERNHPILEDCLNRFKRSAEPFLEA